MSKRQIEFFVFDIFIAILKIEKTSSKFTNPQDLLHSYTDWDNEVAVALASPDFNGRYNKRRHTRRYKNSFVEDFDGVAVVSEDYKR